MDKSTMVELVTELEKAYALYPHIVELSTMIKEAKAGEYHDFKNRKYACGKVASSLLLHELIKRYPDAASVLAKIRVDIMDGEYDEVADEEDRIEMSKAIDENESDPAKAEALKKMLGLVKTEQKNGPFGKRYF